MTKEFLSQFKTEDDVSKFLTKLHAQVLEKMLEGEMDVHLGYEKNSVAGNNSGNSRNGKYPKKIQTMHGESVISVPRDRNGEIIAGGQALGQKNTVFAIWFAYTFLTPVTAIAGGFYSLWHNLVNTWQLYNGRHHR